MDQEQQIPKKAFPTGKTGRMPLPFEIVSFRDLDLAQISDFKFSGTRRRPGDQCCCIKEIMQFSDPLPLPMERHGAERMGRGGNLLEYLSLLFLDCLIQWQWTWGQPRPTQAFNCCAARKRMVESWSMIGTLLNAAAIITGGAIGLTVARDISPVNQSRLKIALGVLTVYAGLSLTWTSISGSFLSVLKQLTIVILAMMLGNFTGKLLRLQKGVNSIGQYAKARFSSAATHKDQARFSEGFVTCSLLFCVGPMAILGAVEDGLTGKFKTLAIKSIMDGLATMAFVKTFGWGVMLAAIPVVAYQGSITLGAFYLQPLLEHKDLVDSINATGGLLIFSISLIILELKKVRLADYLPSLIYAPLLTWFWR